MRIHTNTLTIQHLQDAANAAGVDFHRLTIHGSRKRAKAFDVILSGTGLTGTRWGNSSDRYQAATWDEWGIFLGALFRADQDVTIPSAYLDADHFAWSTGDRYGEDFGPDDQHVSHRWAYDGTVCTGAYTIHTCKCGATRRFMVRGTFADLANRTAA